jgi:ABC-type bacteriocin/lantibiotic exporter with double-glycine peptidase domain
MTMKVIRAKIQFFDSNPIGRIITRFSKDLVIMDMLMPFFLFAVCTGIFRGISVAIMVVVVNPWLLIPLAMCVVVMYFIMRFGVRPMVQTQVFDSNYRAPVHQTFVTLINGLVSFRAYKKIDFYKIDFMENVEKGANATFCFNFLN